MSHKERYLILHSTQLLYPVSVSERKNQLDLEVDENEFYPHAVGYLRMLSDLTNKQGVKLVLVDEYEERKEECALEELIKKCKSVGIPTPKIHAKFFYKKLDEVARLSPRKNRHGSVRLDSSPYLAVGSDVASIPGGRPSSRSSSRQGTPKPRRKKTAPESLRIKPSDIKLLPDAILKYSEAVKFQVHYAKYFKETPNHMHYLMNLDLKLPDGSSCFVFCNNDFGEDYDGCVKYVGRWTPVSFFKHISELVLKEFASPENVFTRIVKYSEFFVDENTTTFGGKPLFVKNLPRGMDANSILERIDQMVSEYHQITPELWENLCGVKRVIDNNEPIFNHDDIVSKDESKMKKQYRSKSKNFSTTRLVWKNGFYDRRSRQLKTLLDGFFPIYIAQLENMLAQFAAKADSLQSRGYKEVATKVNDIKEHVEGEIFWLTSFYGNLNDKPFAKLYGLINCIENCFEAFDDDHSVGDYLNKSALSDLCFQDIMKNLILFFLASITVIPIVVYCIYYKVQNNKNSRYTFWNTPEKEAYILVRDAKEVLNQPSYEGINVPAA